MKYRILNTIGEAFDTKAKEILNTIGQVDYKIPSQGELVRIIDQYDFVICGLGLNFNEEVLSKPSNLKALATATTGLDHIDLKYAENRGIKIVSLKGEDEFLNTITGTAELALGLMIMLARKVPPAHTSVMNGNWDRDRFRGNSLFGQTLGIVGLGRLGRMMARYGESLGMKVLYCDPNVKSIEHNYKKVSFDELLKESDFISVHVHLNKETEYMFNKTTLSKMKSTAFLINTSRGKIVNENNLINSIKNKEIAGYGTDVLDGEVDFINNDSSNHPLVKYSKDNPNIIILPHIGGMTYESRRDTDIFIAKKILNVI